MKTNCKFGFSLMEMMIVLLIVAIIAAASAPMINKKLVKTAAGSSSPWVWTSLINNSIAYNLKGNNNAVATIGASRAPVGLNTRLYISSTNTQIPQISMGVNGAGGLHIKASDSSLLITDRANAYAENTVTIGRDALSSSGGVIIGDNAQTASDATDVVAVGRNSRASSDSSTAVGHAASASGDHSTVVGAGASSTSSNTTSVGEIAQATGTFATAIGSDAQAQTRASVALGCLSRANGGLGAAVALGTQSEALAWGALATGWRAIARAGRTVALGYCTEAKTKATGSIAIGSNATTEGPQSIAIGSQASAANTNTIAIGNHTQVTDGEEGIAIGNTTNVGFGSVALGSQALAEGRLATAIGAAATASQNSSTAIGTGARASFDSSTAIGTGARASLGSSTAIGSGARAFFSSSTAIGAGAETYHENQIVLGTPNDTVYIPGNLVVGKNAYLNTTQTKNGKHPYYTAISPLSWDHRLYYLEKVHKANFDKDKHRYFILNEKHFPETVTNGYITSDRRLKNVGKPFVGGLEQIKKMKVFNYTFKQDKTNTPQVGVMAQDLQKVFPNAVFKGDDGFLRIRTDEIFYAIINAIKELDAKVTYLMNREKRISDLEKRVEILEKSIKK